MSLQPLHQHRMEQRGNQFYSDGALKSTEIAANRAQAEAVVCERCGKQVHPTNWMKHQKSHHSDDPKPLHESQKDDLLPLAAIRTDGGTQPRSLIDSTIVEEYAEAMNGGAKFPSIVVFFDGQEYWLADGFHRLNAALKLNWLELSADVRQGTQRDAILYSVGVNATHGLRRTNADKRRAVERLLRDEEWSKWSNREIARRCEVGEKLVRSLRPSRSEDERTYTTKHGTEATMHTGNIGKSTAKADEQATQVFEPPVKPTPITYGKVEDDFADDVPSTDVDEPDWLDDALAGKEAESGGYTEEQKAWLDAQLAAKGIHPDPKPAAEPTEEIKYDIGDKVKTTSGRINGIVWNRDYNRVDGKFVYVKFPGSNAFWIEAQPLVLVERAAEAPAPKISDKERERRALSKQQSEERRAAKNEIPEEWDSESRWRVIEGDLIEYSGDILDESVDIIITDPPYSPQFLDCYTKLSQLAARVLKPGGSLICMTGQFCLPDIMTELGRHLNYHWTLSYLTQGGQSPQIWPRKVNTFWKPLLWYVKGAYSGDWMGDVVRSPAINDDKAFHEWGQSVEGFADIVNRFTYPNDLILDPFMGAGTTGLAALQSYRRFIGIDIDKEAVTSAALRLSNLSNEQVRKVNHG